MNRTTTKRLEQAEQKAATETNEYIPPVIICMANWNGNDIDRFTDWLDPHDRLPKICHIFITAHENEEEKSLPAQPLETLIAEYKVTKHDDRTLALLEAAQNGPE